MRYEERKHYKIHNDFVEKYRVYEVEDLVHSDKHEIFDNESRYWKGYFENYRTYLKRGKLNRVSKSYRREAKIQLIRKVVKMYLKMLVEDILKGHKVKLGAHSIYLFINNRSSKSNKFKGKEYKLEFIPYIHIPASITKGQRSRMYYFSLGEKYQKMLNKLLKTGKRYKINNE